jgi:putative protease
MEPFRCDAAEPAGPPPARPELLAPAGDRDALRAAVENGADAVYFGLTDFNARARAKNVAIEELSEVLAELHGRGVKGYVTLNTLVFPGELEQIEATIRRVAEAGADAIIVQDLGVARLARAVCADIELHASTQMSLSSAEGMRLAESLGIRRVILARELSIDEIRSIRRQTSLGLEVFVHGALCISYSGQCLASRSMGGRSANRGRCAQACRMPYQLVCDGRLLDPGGRQYPLSPNDLAAYEMLPALIAAGVNALKIEGRLKSAEYVAGVTRHYRAALDAACEGRAVQFARERLDALELPFSRGFSQGWLHGPNHRALVPGDSSSKRGTYLGCVTRIARGRVAVELAGPIKRGDGIVFEGGRAAGTEQGGRVYEVFCERRSIKEPVAAGEVELTFARGHLDYEQIRPGQRVWKTDDPAVARQLRKSYNSRAMRRRVPIDLTVEAAVGRPLRITARAAAGPAVGVESPQALQTARKHPLGADVLREQLGRLGGTAYELRELATVIDGSPMVPLSVLGKLRHAMIEKLDAAMARPAPRQLAPGPVLAILRQSSADQGARADDRPSAPRLYVLCRSPAQLEHVLQADTAGAIADFPRVEQYGDAVGRARSAGARIALATPRMHRPGETAILAAMLAHGPDAVLVRNLAALEFFARYNVPMIADGSLNAANELTVRLLRQWGVRRVTVAHDLGAAQVLDLAAGPIADALEMVVHQHVPMFHTEHCLFCAALSQGNDRTTCGRPCQSHALRLRDRVGLDHPLWADGLCRNTVYNALPQSAAYLIPALVARGLRHFRIELLEDFPADRLPALLAVYRDLLSSAVGSARAWRRLQSIEPGVSRSQWRMQRGGEVTIDGNKNRR